MAKRPSTIVTEQRSTQAEPTQPRPVDHNGYQLDEHGLPLVGPARRRVLEKLRAADPERFPDDWDGVSLPPERSAPIDDDGGADRVPAEIEGA
ncbi:hypothetical protein LZK98_08155 [Sphingomonas cannabina]|uniref:hypothetical protein n=1 Tax=Sphingomonas cannabina TaxID=2899123 RepID=UPI001F39AF79|nr:hypothetical protein [Sphingomonas cannabina]UIJ46901.1 hypothetical protein LZK98_08155 [Sphingomonas cannabina]